MALEDGPGGRRTATPSGSRRAVGPLRPSVVAADGRPMALSSAGGLPWDRRTRPDIRRMRPWTPGRVTTLFKTTPILFSFLSIVLTALLYIELKSSTFLKLINLSFVRFKDSYPPVFTLEKVAVSNPSAPVDPRAPRVQFRNPGSPHFQCPWMLL
jgi:hypothetical protein